jgi:hypothetical protein
VRFDGTTSGGDSAFGGANFGYVGRMPQYRARSRISAIEPGFGVVGFCFAMMSFMPLDLFEDSCRSSPRISDAGRLAFIDASILLKDLFKFTLAWQTRPLRFF